MKKNRDCRIIRLGDRILRILDAEEEKALVIDCVKMGMPKWISLSEIKDGVEISEEEFVGEMERDIPEEMSASARQTMHERFTVISGIPIFTQSMTSAFSSSASCPVWGIKSRGVYGLQMPQKSIRSARTR